MKQFGLIGVAGYIAPRHLNAIKETGNNLLVAMDTNDSVGIMDSHFPEAEFFTEFETFQEFIEDQKLLNIHLDYISICSPNYLHLPHIKFALQNGIDVICEKPLALNEANLDTIKLYETKFKAKVNAILQLRLHPSITQLKKKISTNRNSSKYDVELTYLTSRGKWYMRSWKGNTEKSGGVISNIGIHFFDMLHYLFGNVIDNKIHYHDAKTAAGCLEYEHAHVRWFLSIDANFLPDNAIKGEKLTYRNITINGESLEFSDGFTDLHTKSYQNVISGNGFEVEDNRSAISTVENMSKLKLDLNISDAHPLFKEKFDL